MAQVGTQFDVFVFKNGFFKVENVGLDM